MISLTPAEIALAKPAADLAMGLLKPLAQKAWKWTEQAAERAKFEMCFGVLETSLQNSYNRHSYFTSLVFKNEQKKLDDYYLPLTILKHPKNEPHLIDDFPVDLFSQYRRLLIVDSAGMGKSTLSKFLFLSCVRESTAIPILIELRKLSKTNDIIDFIVESTENIAGESQRELIINLVNSGRFIFLFDGYDEISDTDRSDVIRNISEFVAAAPDNWYLMTSRDEGSLSAFPDFQRFTIKPLDKDEAYRLLRLYDQNGECADALIEKIEDGTNVNVHEFLTNPLLVSLLYKSFEFKRSIPIRKHIFYRQVFEALFETHDLMKEEYQREKRSGLDIDQFDELLRYLSFLTYRDGKFEYTKDELLSYIEKIKQLIANQDLVSSHVVHDLTHGVPLMVTEGNYIKWVHRSMQEYFTALWVCRDSKEKQQGFLTKMYKDVKHQNLIIICADIDPTLFRKSVIKELAINLLKEYELSYLRLPCAISKETIEERKKLVTGHTAFLSIADMAQVESNLQRNEYDRKLIEGMRKYCASMGYPFTSARWNGQMNTVELVFLGYIQKPPYAMLDIPQFLNLIPFVVQQHINGGQPQAVNFDIHAVEFLPIDDDPNNPANSENNFSNVNLLLGQQQPRAWYFDYTHAKKLLKDIEAEITESEALEL